MWTAKLRRAGREENRRNDEVSDHDNWPSFALFRFLHADTVSRARMFRIDVIRQFRVKVGGRSRFSPMRIVLVSIPLYLLLYSSPPRVEMGNPRNIWARVSTPARQVERENIRGKGRIEMSKGTRKGEKESFPKTVSSSVRFRKATAGRTGQGLKDGMEENRPAYRDY